MDSSTERLSIYKAARTIKKRENTLYNALRSIYEDSIFVGEISQLWPQLPLLANLRCGLWYSPKFHSTCYFKSTDGHTNNWSFNTSRLNIHVGFLAGQRGGCMIVDSTRKGKRFPDSMSKTIPIWTCVLNRAIANYRSRSSRPGTKEEKDSATSSGSANYIEQELQDTPGWDCSLHLPLWVSDTERALIESRLEGWTNELEASGADIASLASSLEKPLRPLWISQKTVIWLNEVPDYDSWDFTPIILVSTSALGSTFRTTSEFSWNYIAGAGDDEESWARGMSPELYWKHIYDLIGSGPNLCNQKVADIVEKDRVFRSQRGELAPQVSVKPSKSSEKSVHISNNNPPNFDIPHVDWEKKSSTEDCAISWLGPTNIAVGTSQLAIEASGVDCILNCDKNPLFLVQNDPESYLHLPIVGSKFDRFSLLRHLPCAVGFAKKNLRKGKRLLICCSNGKPIKTYYRFCCLVGLVAHH